jgi:hypothetical protein
MPAWLTLPSIAIYQLRVLLCGVSPLVWRRLLVISETSLAELHEILRTAFDWSGEHLHRFLLPKRPCPECGQPRYVKGHQLPSA